MLKNKNKIYIVIYLRMIKNVHHNPNKFPVEMNKFYRYEKHLIEMEGKLLDGYIFQVFMRVS